MSKTLGKTKGRKEGFTMPNVMVKLLALRLTNTLAYLVRCQRRKKYSFVILTPGALTINLFTGVIDK